MNDICLEKVTSRDEAEIVSKLANKIWTEYYTPILGKAQIEFMLQKFSSPDRIMNDINDSGFVYFMVIYNSKLAGYTAIQPDFESKTLFLSKLYVDKTFRGLGISRFIINFLKDEFKQQQLNTIWLTVNKNNANSINVYKKLGFSNSQPLVTDIGGGFIMDDYKMSISF